MNKEECERAIEVIDDYVNGSALKENPTKYEANKAIEVIDRLIIEHFNMEEELKELRQEIKLNDFCSLANKFYCNEYYFKYIVTAIMECSDKDIRDKAIECLTYLKLQLEEKEVKENENN